MSEIYLYKVKPKRLSSDNFTEIARYLEMKGKHVETDEALFIHDSKRALAYAQPGAKFAGLLFYTDQSIGMAASVQGLVDVKRAKLWADDFLSSFGLVPGKPKDKRIKFSFELLSYQTEAVKFDGKERHRTKTMTETRSKIHLNEIPVMGPRSKVRMVFKNQKRPIFIHRGLWESIEVYEERELLEAEDIVAVVKKKLDGRRKSWINYDIIGKKLVYLAYEFKGGPDLLAPFYFIEVEYEDTDAKKKGINQGPKQLFRVPAYGALRK